jgi:hypothetical protein
MATPSQLKLSELILRCFVEKKKRFAKVEAIRSVCVDLAKEGNVDFVFNAIDFMRNDLNLSAASNFLLAVLCNTDEFDTAIRARLNNYFQIPTDVIEILDFYQAGTYQFQFNLKILDFSVQETPKYLVGKL